MTHLPTSLSVRRANHSRAAGRPGRLRLVALSSLALSLAAAAAVPAAPPTQPAATPPGARALPTQDEKVATLLKYLETEAYGKKLAAPYWVTRAMGVISMAKLPQAGATARLLDVLDKDKHDVVRLLAWQAVLARAKDVDAATYKRWSASTLALAEKGAFRGRLRVALLDALAVAPPNAKSKRVWQAIFGETNAWEPQDVPVLEALGRTLAAWRSPDLAEALIKGMTDPNACVRSEQVLHAAGCDAPTAHETLDPSVFDPNAPNRKHPSSVDLWRKVQAGAVEWLTKHRAEWKEATAAPGEPWKQLSPAFVAAPVARDAVDPSDPLWTSDLELGKADLGQIEAVFVVDATGSMGDVLTWLKRDVARVMLAFGAVSKEPPKMGIVFYRDRGDSGFVTMALPMTYKPQDFEPKLSKIEADGGGDIPEAVLDGLKLAVDGMAWSSAAKRAGSGKVMILVGDAPPKPGTEKDCDEVAKRGAAKGIKTYAVKVTTAEGKNDLTTFDSIAAAGGGSTVEATFGRLSQFRIINPVDQKEIPVKTVDRPEAQLIVATSTAEMPPGEKVLVHVLSDLISPQYKDRVEPLAQTLLANVQAASEPEKRLAYAANTPPLGKATFNAQKK